MKNLSYLMVVFAFLISCGTSEKKSKESASEARVITVDEFWANPDEFVGSEVIITGRVVHVCQHGGKRMFIIGDESEDRLQIKATDEVTEFPIELEGSLVEIRGIADELRIDEQYLRNWENELKAENPESELKIHRGEEGHEHGEGDINAELEQINSYRQMLAEQQKEYLSFYSIKCKSFTEIK